MSGKECDLWPGSGRCPSCIKAYATSVQKALKKGWTPSLDRKLSKGLLTTAPVWSGEWGELSPAVMKEGSAVPKASVQGTGMNSGMSRGDGKRTLTYSLSFQESFLS